MSQLRPLLALVDENRALRQKVIYLCSRKLESLDNRIAYIGTRPAGEKDGYPLRATCAQQIDIRSEEHTSELQSH